MLIAEINWPDAIIGIVGGTFGGMIVGVVTSIFFYRKSILDPVRFRLAFLDAMTVHDNECRSGGDGLDSTCHFLDCYHVVLDQAGMINTARTVKQISSEMWDLRNAPNPRDHPPDSEERRLRELGRPEMKQLWQNTFAGAYSLGSAFGELIPMLTPKWMM